ncbi:MAG: hypothetical protein K6T85_19640 [Gorillibacterium sp.]|nr:hypothetical protein [Gorillibacterium sp.]
MKKMILVSLILVFSCSFFYPKGALALSCAELPTVELAYDKYDAVIIGQVEDVVRNKISNEIKINVLNSFKGIEERKIALAEDITWGALDGPSIKGRTYLFFLRKQNNEWENPLCSPTKLSFDATDEELSFLQNKEIPLKTESVSTQSPINEKLLNTPSPINGIEIAVILILIGVTLFAFIRYKKHKSQKR